MSSDGGSIVFFHAPLLIKIALDARDLAIEAEHAAEPGNMSQDALVAIVMAAASAEAFVNELAAVGESGLLFEGSALVAAGSAISSVEANHGSTEDKYLTASMSLPGAPFDRGKPPFQDFAKLMKLRNHLMHASPVDAVERSSDAYVAQPPPLIGEFERRRMTVWRAPGVSMSWLNLLQSARMATWACQAAVAPIVALVEMITRDGGPTMWRGWVEHYQPRASGPSLPPDVGRRQEQ